MVGVRALARIQKPMGAWGTVRGHGPHSDVPLAAFRPVRGHRIRSAAEDSPGSLPLLTLDGVADSVLQFGFFEELNGAGESSPDWPICGGEPLLTQPTSPPLLQLSNHLLRAHTRCAHHHMHMVRTNRQSVQLPGPQLAVLTDDPIHNQPRLRSEHIRLTLQSPAVAELPQRIRRQPIRIRRIVPLVHRPLHPTMQPCPVGVPGQEVRNRIAVHAPNLTTMRTLSASSGSPATGEPMPPTEYAAQSTPGPVPDGPHALCRDRGP